MSRTPTELDTLIRNRARVDHYAKIDVAWQAFCQAVRTKAGSYSAVLDKQGRELVEALKIEQKSEIEQRAVEDFLRKFEEFGAQIAQLEDVTYEH